MANKALILSENKQSRAFHGYFILVAGFLILMIIYGAQFSFGLFFKPVLNEFGWTRAVTAGAYSLNVVGQGVFGIIAGKLSDRFGPRPVVTVCGLFLGSGYLLMSQINSVWQIYLFYGILISIGSSTWVPLMSTIARWFVKKRGLVSGIVSAGVGAGTIVTPPLANQLISSYDWRLSYIIIGVIALVVMVVSAQFLRRDPGQMKQLAYGADEINNGYSDPGTQGLSSREALRTRQLWIIGISFFAANFCLQTIIVHFVPYATDIGISAASAATMVAILGAVSMVGKISMGSAVDRIGSKRVMVIVLGLMAVSLLWLQLYRELWALNLFAVVFAIGYGGYVAIQSPVVAEFFGLKAHGAILGMVMFGNFSGGALGPLLAGRIYDTTTSYSLAFTICAVFSTAGAILATQLKIIRKEGLV